MPDPRHAPPQTELGRVLAEAIGERGPITFADYQQIALYHPQGGYYTDPARTPQGWEGDYLTSADLHPLFGAAIGRQLAQIWALLGQPVPFVVLEDGAGRGLLARDVFAWARDPLGDAPADFADAVHYWLRDVQGERQFLPHPQPFPSAEEEAEIPQLPQVILSNELVDALPVHVVERTAAGLAEVYVDAVPRDGAWRLVERLGPLSAPDLVAYFARYGVAWERMDPGWRAEISLAAEAWMTQTAQRLAPRGCVITIDYGDTAKRLYTPDRRHGTLRCYFRHALGDDPLALTGLQDITAHVNFTALARVGRVHGLKQAGLVTQRAFLLALGIRQDADALGSRLFPLAETERHTDAGQRDYLRRASLNHAISALLDPAGMGDFRVLVQHRGLPGAGNVLLGLRGEAAHR
jgi:SAM-dependent MidA family methyltransferase